MPTSVAMLVRITTKRKVTFPAHVLVEIGAGPGDHDHLELIEAPGGYLLQPRRID